MKLTEYYYDLLNNAELSKQDVLKIIDEIQTEAFNEGIEACIEEE